MKTQAAEKEMYLLARKVETLFGSDAVSRANDRAYELVAYARDGDPDEWLRVFTDAFNADLRRLLTPH